MQASLNHKLLFSYISEYIQFISDPDVLSFCLCVLELLKRLDDSSQEVRVEALKALSVWLSSLDKNFDTHTHRPNLEYLFQHLLLYLDDPDHQIQLMVLGKC